jgi:hypothetical protein
VCIRCEKNSENGDSWRDTRSRLFFIGTPSQLLDAPRPLFVDGRKRKVKDDGAGKDMKLIDVESLGRVGEI